MQHHHGLLVIDKPTGITSRDAVNRLQKLFPRGTRIGHMGTLDPLATGVLVLGVGEGTRLTEYVQDMDKVYLAGIRLGAVSDTDDADGQIDDVDVKAPPSLEEVQRELARFLGAVEQVPPSFSAIKVTGRRAYDLARGGRTVDLTPRIVQIYGITLIRYAYPHLQIQVHCGKGTYIRSLARDLGKRLGCGGLIASLRRLSIGPFTTELAAALDSKTPPPLLPLAMAVQRLPRIVVGPAQIDFLRHGRPVKMLDQDSRRAPHAGFRRGAGGSPARTGEPRVEHAEEESVKAMFSPEGELVGIGKIEDGELRPMRILLGKQGSETLP